jgi:hypothetical protein
MTGHDMGGKRKGYTFWAQKHLGKLDNFKTYIKEVKYVRVT